MQEEDKSVLEKALHQWSDLKAETINILLYNINNFV
jgi:hypothetical protein